MALGSDLWGELDLSPHMPIVEGRTALAQAVIRRLTTPTGQLADYPEYGHDIRDMVGRAVVIETERAAILTQCLAEEEVLNAQVTIIQDGDVWRVGVQLEDEDGPFDLTLNVSELGTEAIVEA